MPRRLGKTLPSGRKAPPPGCAVRMQKAADGVAGACAGKTRPAEFRLEDQRSVLVGA